LCDFLGLEYTSLAYPDEEEVGQRTTLAAMKIDAPNRATDLKFDASP